MVPLSSKQWALTDAGISKLNNGCDRSADISPLRSCDRGDSVIEKSSWRSYLKTSQVQVVYLPVFCKSSTLLYQISGDAIKMNKM
jgi:hypothetical protein